ncbi:MAG: hypothetical protein JSR17_00990 [Proteobacteria bacterium]|nr:hypothetical protein [Pseudomonadota bacterium]
MGKHSRKSKLSRKSNSRTHKSRSHSRKTHRKYKRCPSGSRKYCKKNRASSHKRSHKKRRQHRHKKQKGGEGKWYEKLGFKGKSEYEKQLEQNLAQERKKRRTATAQRVAAPFVRLGEAVDRGLVRGVFKTADTIDRTKDRVEQTMKDIKNMPCNSIKKCLEVDFGNVYKALADAVDKMNATIKNMENEQKKINNEMQKDFDTTVRGIELKFGSVGSKIKQTDTNLQGLKNALSAQAQLELKPVLAKVGEMNLGNELGQTEKDELERVAKQIEEMKNEDAKRAALKNIRQKIGNGWGWFKNMLGNVSNTLGSMADEDQGRAFGGGKRRKYTKRHSNKHTKRHSSKHTKKHSNRKRKHSRK